MCQTTEAILSQHEILRRPHKTPNPAECPQCSQAKSAFWLQVLFTILGVLVAVSAAYLMVATDSRLYLVFWIAYSVLRRMMKKKTHVKAD
ncbi:hypothetical protein JYU34_010425 [Plutella xylostella]|uniref:Uncharacterized protein n=1 Tax=Plutella xylostella TaxID=51655 RepID=A0ABQ7QID3_PLUXY|nr:hypothetical protein JYU34_010425 [Plutella xylostella]